MSWQRPFIHLHVIKVSRNAIGRANRKHVCINDQWWDLSAMQGTNMKWRPESLDITNCNEVDASQQVYGLLNVHSSVFGMVNTHCGTVCRGWLDMAGELYKVARCSVHHTHPMQLSQSPEVPHVEYHHPMAPRWVIWKADQCQLSCALPKRRERVGRITGNSAPEGIRDDGRFCARQKTIDRLKHLQWRSVWPSRHSPRWLIPRIRRFGH